MDRTTTSGGASGRTTEYLELMAENAALRARVDELEAQLKAREEDFRTQNTLLLKIAELKRRNEELEAQLEIMEGRAIVAENEVFRLTRYVPPVTSNESDTQYITYSDNRTYDGEGTA